jgi:hypothetical protein
MRSNRVQVAALLGLLLALGLGVWGLLRLRTARGDIYPRYSTLRADPLGARVLLEALREVDGLSARRSTQPLGRLWEDSSATLFVLGAAPSILWDDASDESLELVALVRQGLRAVIAVAPVADAGMDEDDDADDDEDASAGGAEGRESGRSDRPEKPTRQGPPAPEPSPSPTAPRRLPLGRLLGFALTHVPLPKDEQGEAVADVARREGRQPTALDLPETLPWHTTLCFADLAAGWRVLYSRGGRPVLIERDLGRGSLVLSADSFVLSNEALRLEPRASLVSWLVGENRTIIFDETHLGISERPGVASLMRRYVLHGVIAAVLLLAGLFVWRVSVPFVPPIEEPGGTPDQVISGRDAAAGLVTLLRRGIPRSDILRVCREEWIRTLGNRRPDLVAAMTTLGEGPGDPLEIYRHISRALKEMRIDDQR